MWAIKAKPAVKKQLKKIDSTQRRKIQKYLEEKVAVLDDPRTVAKALTGSFKGLHRFRVGDYRIVAQIIDKEITILVLRVSHRKNVYNQN